MKVKIRRFAKSILDSIADAGEKFLDLTFSGTSTKSLVNLCRDLVSHKGVASGIALARNVVHQYASLDMKERLKFFQELSDNFGPDMEAIKKAAKDFELASDSETLRNLASKMESDRRKLFSRMNMAPNGTSAIVALRQDLLGFVREHPEIAAVDEDLAQLLTTWFNPGFLSLERIDWHTEASLLEKIIEYETVHNIADWNDLKQRLVENRRCFAFFHPALEGEPLIFVEVALVKGMASSVQMIIHDQQRNGEDPDTAIFYSINNCQKGLTRIPLGNFLIKRVVSEIARDLPSIKTYCTLSPITGFSRWLKNELNSTDSGVISLTDKDKLDLTNDPSWHRAEGTLKVLKEPLIRACANYLVKVKKNNNPINSVARFHFGNGASLHRINWLGDTSKNGFNEYCGLMVNYLYDLKQIESNHEAYVKDRKIAISKSIRSILK